MFVRIGTFYGHEWQNDWRLQYGFFKNILLSLFYDRHQYVKPRYYQVFSISLSKSFWIYMCEAVNVGKHVFFILNFLHLQSRWIWSFFFTMIHSMKSLDTHTIYKASVKIMPNQLRFIWNRIFSYVCLENLNFMWITCERSKYTRYKDV